MKSKVGIGALLGGMTAFYFDPQLGKRRRTMTRDRLRRLLNREGRRAARGVRAELYGVSQKLRHRHEQPKDYDDATLAHKVESELFRPADVPKGKIVVNAVGGVVQLRGTLESQELVDTLVERTRQIQGVRDVENLLAVGDS